MPLRPDEEPQAAEDYLRVLSADESARQRHQAASGSPEATASAISNALGREVHTSNLSGMAQHLNVNHPERVADVSAKYPSLTTVIFVADEGSD